MDFGSSGYSVDVGDGNVSSRRNVRLRSQLIFHLPDPNIVRPVETSQSDTSGDRRNRAVRDGLISLSRLEASSLSSVPWKRLGLSFDSTCGANRHRTPENDDHSGYGKEPRTVRSNYSYLDLRLSQNLAWANSRLRSGVEHAKRAQVMEDDSQSMDAVVREYRNAENCYRDGLDLIPSHPELLVAYGALCANLRRDEDALEMLTKAVKLTCTGESNVESGIGMTRTMGHVCNGEKSEEATKEAQSSAGRNARRYLAEVTRRMAINYKQASLTASTAGPQKINRFALLSSPLTKHTVMSKGGEARAKQARSDALAERAFSLGSIAMQNGSIDNAAGQSMLSKYELIGEPLSEYDEDYSTIVKSDSQEGHEIDRRRRKKRKKKYKKKNRKNRRHRSNSFSWSQCRTDDDDKVYDRGKGFKVKHCKGRRKEQKRRRNDSYCGDRSLSSSSPCSIKSRYESDSSASLASSSSNHQTRGKNNSGKLSRRKKKRRRRKREEDDCTSRK